MTPLVSALEPSSTYLSSASRQDDVHYNEAIDDDNEDLTRVVLILLNCNLVHFFIL